MNRKIKLLATVLVFSLVFSLYFAIRPNTAQAATSPSLGIDSTYGIVSGTFTNANAGTETTINGNVCYTTGPATAPIAINGTTSTPCDPATGTAQTAALSDLNSQSCTSLGANVVLSGTYTPGCYSSTGTMDIALSTTVTLSGAGTYIFRAGGALTTGANSRIVLTNGASANDVFWTPVGGTTLGANSSTSATPTFYGNIFRGTAAGLSITLGQFVHLEGRLLAFGSTVTTDANTITVPTTLNVIKTVVNDNGGTSVASGFNVHVKLAGVEVSGSPAVGLVSPGRSYSLSAGTYVVSEDANASYALTFSGDCNSSGSVTLVRGDSKTCTLTNNDIASSGGSAQPATITVVKNVINDNGRTKVTSDFPLFVNGTLVVSGQSNNFPAPTTAYTITETRDPNYTVAFSGDCDVNGQVSLNPGDNRFCIVTNDDIGAAVAPSTVPPLIDVVKVPSPLSLPNGPGPVTYTYTLRNIGTVPVTNITMVGDTCSPIARISGDINNNSILEVNETWKHTCSTTLSATHTNTVAATGWANGISAVDVASSTVVVGVPIVPPLIHVTKVPTPLALSTGGGNVTYRYDITNPGTVALSNVRITDDKCSPMNYLGGDTNGNGMLESTETWAINCQVNLIRNTTNTVSVQGSANGLTARDIAVATVLVFVPSLAATGFPPQDTTFLVIFFGLILTFITLSSISLVALLKKNSIK